jgi:type I restriction enzyme, S subunit
LNSAHFNVPVAVPPEELVIKFEQIVLPMLKLRLNLQDKIENLRTTRDLLLPKLISGELDVSTLPDPKDIGG